MNRKQRRMGQRGQRRLAHSSQGAGLSSANRIAKLMSLALEHHRSGRLGQAEQCCQEILAIEPNQVDGLHLLGVVAHQTARNELAVELIGNALAMNDQVPVLHYNMALALRALGRTDDEIAHLRRAIDLRPDYLEALWTLGNIFRERGELDGAIACYRAALAARPDDAEARNNLGAVFMAQGKLAEAIDQFQQALAIKPDHAEAHYNLGSGCEIWVNRSRQ